MYVPYCTKRHRGMQWNIKRNFHHAVLPLLGKSIAANTWHSAEFKILRSLWDRGWPKILSVTMGVSVAPGDTTPEWLLGSTCKLWFIPDAVAIQQMLLKKGRVYNSAKLYNQNCYILTYVPIPLVCNVLGQLIYVFDTLYLHTF